MPREDAGVSERGTAGGRPSNEDRGATRQSEVLPAITPTEHRDELEKSLAVWASGPDIQITVCFDARLEGGKSILQYPAGTTSGQAGWDMGINFTSLSDLASKLYQRPLATPKHISGQPIKKGQITRLAINVHGIADGTVFVNGKNHIPLTPDNIDKWRAELRDIGFTTSENATILFMGCVAGLGKNGTRLLVALSNLWPGRSVVGFATIGYALGGEMKRRGENCTNPGMRATDYIFASPTQRQEAETSKKWKDLNELPWASEGFMAAKIALNGKIVKGQNF